MNRLLKKDPFIFKKSSVIPGFWLTFGWTIFYLLIIVIIPLGGLLNKASAIPFAEFIENITAERVVSAYKISFGIALIASLINVFFGLVTAWVLARYKFCGQKFIDALIDLPFALPTAIAGIALTALYTENGWLGQHLSKIGIKVAFTPIGIGVALVFVGLPFVVRAVQPVIEELDREMEEVAISLGASKLQTFTKIIFPNIFPSLLSGFAMALARGLGEYGSVVFIAGNMPFISEIVPLIITMKLEQYDYNGATAVAVVMLIASFVMLLLINLINKWSSKIND